MTKTAILLVDQNKTTNHPIMVLDADFDFLAKNDPGFRTSASLKHAYSNPLIKTVLIAIYILEGSSGAARRKIGLFHDELGNGAAYSKLKEMCAEIGIDIKSGEGEFQRLSTVKRADRDLFKSIFKGDA